MKKIKFLSLQLVLQEFVGCKTLITGGDYDVSSTSTLTAEEIAHVMS